MTREPRPVQPTVSQCEEGYVDVAGARVHCVSAGSGRPLLLIHGLIGSCSNWHRNLDALAGVARVYAIDLVNAGRSDRIAGLAAGLEATADRIAATMDVLGLDEADVAGHSHGGAAALMLAARHPRRVRRLILFAPANPFCSSADTLVRLYSSAAGRALARRAPYLPRWMQRIALGRMYGDPARIRESCLKQYIDGLRVPGTVDHTLAIVREWFADMEKLRAALPLLADVPTLLVWGDRDRAVSLASGVRLQREMKASELAVVRGGGHVVFEELPEDSNRIVIEWLLRDLGSSLVAGSDSGLWFENDSPCRD